MKFFALALLVSSTSAATALSAPTPCHNNAVNTAFTAGIADATKAAALSTAALACTTSLVIATGEANTKGFMIENAMWAPQNVRVLAITSITAADQKLFYTNLNEFGVALGMGSVGCATSSVNAATVTCPAARVLLKGSLAVQAKAMKFAVDYFIAGKTACDKVTDATKKTACTTAMYAGFKKWGTAIAAGDAYSSLTAAKSTEWFTAEDKKNVAAALALLVPAPGTVGASCKAAAAVAPATVGIRPTCAAANCCMGYKASATATANSVNGELCQLKTLLKG